MSSSNCNLIEFITTVETNKQTQFFAGLAKSNLLNTHYNWFFCLHKNHIVSFKQKFKQQL